MFEALYLSILIASVLVVASIFTSLISFRVGAPLLLIFLVVGLVAGEDGPGGIRYDDAYGAYFIGSIALAIILFDSGFDTRWQSFRVAAAPAIVLATVGVLLTAIGVGVAARFVFGLSWLESMLLGAIVSSTDAAAVFFLLRVGGIRLRDRVRSTLETESASNDPMAIFLTIAFVEMIMSDADASALTWGLLRGFAAQAGIGGICGILGGLLIVQVVNRVDLETALYPVVVLAMALTLFSAVGLIGGSGFLAVYIAGLIAGNSRIRQQTTLRRFQSGLTWLAQITMFLTLGLFATPSEFPAVILPAIGVALILTFLARPIAVWLCMLPFGFNRNETAFMAWVGLRGAVSVLLGILPLASGLEGGQIMFNSAFIIVVTSLILQGWTIPAMARWLGVTVPVRVGPLQRVELELPGGGEHEVVAYGIHPESPVGKGQRIPRWARPSLIVRDSRSMKPDVAGRLRAGDQVYIITLPKHVPLLDRLFAGPVATEASDQLFYGDFALAPDAPISDVAATYDFSVKPEDEGRTVAEILQREFGADVEVGDRLPYGPVELIVRSITEDHVIDGVGLAIEQTAPARPHLPIFHGRRDIAAFLRRLRDRTIRRSPATTDVQPVEDVRQDATSATDPPSPRG